MLELFFVVSLLLPPTVIALCAAVLLFRPAPRVAESAAPLRAHHA
jgi:hypothetical protein